MSSEGMSLQRIREEKYRLKKQIRQQLQEAKDAKEMRKIQKERLRAIAARASAEEAAEREAEAARASPVTDPTHYQHELQVGLFRKKIEQKNEIILKQALTIEAFTSELSRRANIILDFKTKFARIQQELGTPAQVVALVREILVLIMEISLFIGYIVYGIASFTLKYGLSIEAAVLFLLLLGAWWLTGILGTRFGNPFSMKMHNIMTNIAVAIVYGSINILRLGGLKDQALRDMWSNSTVYASDAITNMTELTKDVIYQGSMDLASGLGPHLVGVIGYQLVLKYMVSALTNFHVSEEGISNIINGFDAWTTTHNIDNFMGIVEANVPDGVYQHVDMPFRELTTVNFFDKYIEMSGSIRDIGTLQHEYIGDIEGLSGQLSTLSGSIENIPEIINGIVGDEFKDVMQTIQDGISQLTQQQAKKLQVIQNLLDSTDLHAKEAGKKGLLKFVNDLSSSARTAIGIEGVKAIAAAPKFFFDIFGPRNNLLENGRGTRKRRPGKTRRRLAYKVGKTRIKKAARRRRTRK